MQLDLTRFPFFSTNWCTYEDLYNSCKSFVKDPTLPRDWNDYSNIKKFPGFVMVYSKWCNNIGYGKYINKSLHKEYHWLQGRDLEKSIISNDYALQFPISMSVEEVKKFGKKSLVALCKKIH